MRCLTIAEAVRDRNALSGVICEGDSRFAADILFLCADEDSAQMVRDRGFRAEVLHTDYRDMECELKPQLTPESEDCEWERILKSNAAACQADALSGNPNIILVDSYFVTDRYLEQLKKYGRVFLVDDLQQHAYPVDGVINYNVFAEETVYRRLYGEQETELLLGGEYVPLRNQFRDVSYNIGNSVTHVMITTGGGDVDNIAAGVLNVINRPDMVFHVLTGRFSPHFSSWKKRAEETGNIRLHYDVQDMAGLMQSCDLAVTAGGSTIYELCAVGVPFICFSFAPNQEALVEYIGRGHIAGSAGAWHLGQAACRDRIGDWFDRLLADRELRETFHEKERQLTDGYGASRLAAALAAGTGRQ